VLDLFKAIRLPNALLVALAQYLILVRHNSLSFKNVLLLLLTSLWILWGNIDNDIQDIELDTRFKKKKENNLIRWLSSDSRGIYLERICLIVSLSASIIISVQAILLTMLAWSGLKFYNLYFKKILLAGNFIIALLCMASLHVFDLGKDTPSLLLSSLIFTATLLREIVKDKEDETADKACGYKTFAIKCNPILFKVTLFGLGLVLIYFAYVYMKSNDYVFTIFALLQLSQFYFILKEQWKKASLSIKIQIFIGVIMIGFI
jgi:4-hydroxybenzoate polyprenyltransferase